MRKHFAETTGHQRLVYGAVVGLTAALLPLPLSVQTQGLVAWCSGAFTYLALAWWLATTFDAHRTRERAQAQDQSSLVLFLLLFLSVFASGVEIGRAHV